MEDFTPQSRVLVTGANGHVAAHVVSQLLARPHETRPIVRATVRSENSGAGLKKHFASAIASGKLEFAFVPDIAEPAAFDDAVRGCTHIAHIASPLAVGAKDVANDLLKPAIRGTEGVLHSAFNYAGPQLKSVVITGSFAAVVDPAKGLRPGYTYTPEDWLPVTHEQAADPDLDLSGYLPRYAPFITYMASKKLAEKAAWDFVAKEKPSFRISVVCPTYIGGPSVLPLVKGPDSLSFSNSLIWKTATTKPGDAVMPRDFPFWVDVRDVADAHIRSLVIPESNGKRFILAPIKTNYSGIAAVARERMGWDNSRDVQDEPIFDAKDDGCQKVLGKGDWVGIEKIIVDTLEQVQDYKR